MGAWPERSASSSAEGVAVDVDDDQVGVAVDELVERGVAVGDRLDFVAVGGEVVSEKEPGGVVGLGEQDAWGVVGHGILRSGVVSEGAAGERVSV